MSNRIRHFVLCILLAVSVISVAYAAKTCETRTIDRCCREKWVGWRFVCVSSKECTIVTCSDGSGSENCGACN